jgi:hypothetical protein
MLLQRAHPSGLSKPATAVLAEVSLNSPAVSLSLAISVVSLASTFWAGYNDSFGFSFEHLVWDDFAAIRAINWMVHFFSLL